MTPEHRQHHRFLALDPARSVVVEACAGSGKTWLLSARLLRLLLAGAQPGEILAITYTRKAAREIEARLRSLLRELASVPEAAALKLLVDRGLAPEAARAALPRARGLFEAMLAAEPPITITTFHGWFARLLSGAPLQSGVAGRSLSEAASSLLDEAWAQLAADCARESEGPVAQALLWLYGESGALSTRRLLRALVERRAEWQVWCAAAGGAEPARELLDAQFGVGRNPFAGCFTQAGLQELEDFARLLGLNTTGDQALGNALAQAVVDLRAALAADPLAGWVAPDATSFAAVRAAFLTAAGSARARKSSAAQLKRLGAGEDTYLALHQAWSERLIGVIEAQRDLRCAVLNRHALVVGEALLAKLAELKRARRVMDFGDLEAEIDLLLASEGTAAWLQARLDARYRHILLDEFQDTNPLQWRILRGWLDGYAGTGAERPSVFLVGDPKQSIYRFRRAEPKLFAAAAEYFCREFGAECVSNAHTFRNAGGIVELVNAVFYGQPGFSAQTTEQAARPARVEILPLIPLAAEDEADAEADQALRLPLQVARVEAEDQRRAGEAALLAERINAMVGRWQVGEGEQARALRYADILILTRAKTRLATYEAALRAAGIPFVSPGQGGLLGTLEAQDLLALLQFLADPADNLRLAHALRAPALGCTDEDLLAISAQPGLWWPALQQLAAGGGAPRLERAVRLLAGWQQDAAHLPAHDLIDRIFHQAEWAQRCRAAVPAARWPGVQANLEALLELALNVDAGRYPSLTRFVDELSRLASADDEAPDEGLVASGGEGQGRVRIMTIHGSKGLEAPVVWLIDANAPARAGEGYCVQMDWPAEAALPQHFSLIGRLGDAGRVHQPLLEAERAAAEREELNLLYVAITRAEQVFIASGVATARASRTTFWDRLSACVPDGVVGALPECAVQAAAEAAVETAPAARVVVGPIGRQRPQAAAVDGAGLAFGSALHAWLEAHANGWPLPAVEAAVEAAARRVLARPALRRFFDPAAYRCGGSETEFVTEAGKRGRIDRWVEADDAIWVLDYKSGQVPDASLLDEYRAQLGGYCATLRAVFPGRAVRALLVFTEGGELEVSAA